MSAADHPPRPPDATFIRSRWVPVEHRERAENCARILVEHGEAHGTTVYTKQEAAKKHARRMCELIDQLRLLGPADVIRHTKRHENGWTWWLEYRGDRTDVAPPRHPSAKPRDANAA